MCVCVCCARAKGEVREREKRREREVSNVNTFYPAPHKDTRPLVILINYSALPPGLREIFKLILPYQ